MNKKNARALTTYDICESFHTWKMNLPIKNDMGLWNKKFELKYLASTNKYDSKISVNKKNIVKCTYLLKAVRHGEYGDSHNGVCHVDNIANIAGSHHSGNY